MRNSSHSSVSMTLEDTDPRDPKAKCDRCSRQGTIARAMRHTDPPMVLRYCGPCWPAAQDELLARQREEGERWQRARSEWFELWRRGAQGTAESPPRPAPWSISSRSWHDTRGFLAAIAQPFEGGTTATSEQLAWIAADIRSEAVEKDGPVPPDVEIFLAAHPPRSA
jgi:hypothetical protein